MLTVGIGRIHLMDKKAYKRDKRSPVPLNDTVSIVMSRNKSKNTKPELLLRKALYQNGIRGYRVNYKKLPGKPDIVFTKKKVVIFVNGCFWHRCPNCNLPMPKSNVTFWKEKFTNNIIRDKNKTEKLQQLGWDVITIWECDLNDKMELVVSNLINRLSGTNGNKSN